MRKETGKNGEHICHYSVILFKINYYDGNVRLAAPQKTVSVHTGDIKQMMQCFSYIYFCIEMETGTREKALEGQGNILI